MTAGADLEPAADLLAAMALHRAGEPGLVAVALDVPADDLARSLAVVSWQLLDRLSDATGRPPLALLADITAAAHARPAGSGLGPVLAALDGLVSTVVAALDRVRLLLPPRPHDPTKETPGG